MKNLTKFLSVAVLLAVMLCACNAPEVTNPSEKPSQAPSVGATEAPSVGTSTQPTDQPTQTPTQTEEYNPGPTVTHQEVSQWDHEFAYGDASIKSTALTRFNDGVQGGVNDGSDGNFTFTEDGLLIVQKNGMYADTYSIYSGANLHNADYSQMKYFGIEVENNEDHSVLFGVQGRSKVGKNVFLYPEGDPIILAGANGSLAIAEGQENVNARYCMVIPAGFKGSVIIPVNRMADSHMVDEATTWDALSATARVIDLLGFHLCDGGTAGVLVKTAFIGNDVLEAPADKPTDTPDDPEKPDDGENEDYSYTSAQRIAPFWENSTMYNESITMIKRSSGVINGKLLFVPEKIIAVYDVYLKKEYKEGVDYQWVEGSNVIKWLEGSSIPYFTENDLSGKNEKGELVHQFDGSASSWDDQGRSRFGNCLYCVSAFLYEKQIAVTYTYDISQVQTKNIYFTEYQGDKLPLTVNKLKNNEAMKVLFYGDSIFSGCDASSMYNRDPRMPQMSNLIKARLQEETEGRITMSNIAVGGWTTKNGNDALSGNINGQAGTDKSNRIKSVDLAIISFGMNDAGTPKASYIADTKGIIDKIRAQNPNAEFILVSCMNPNPRATSFCGNQKNQGAWLKEIANDPNYSSFTAVVDFYEVHASILNYKDYSATTGNNINHPNDWLIRLYAQNILATIIQ